MENIICVRGRDNIKSEEPFKASKTFEIYGVPVYNLRVSDYKDHWYSQMELNKWIDGEQQPDYTLNFPADTKDDQIKELTCETKTAVKDPKPTVRLSISGRERATFAMSYGIY